MSKLALVKVIALSTLATASLDAMAAAGRTAGSFNVSSTGGSTYTIPIFAPPGVKGVQPRMALTYNSQSGNGFVGIGWSLSGLGSIYRCPKTIAQDGAFVAVKLDTSDVFCMSGNRLRMTSSGTYGANGSIYMTEIADFSRVTSLDSANSSPGYFMVEGKDGLTYMFGETEDSRILATGTNTALAWALNRVVDRDGNTMTVTYSQETGTAVPTTIKWTSNANVGAEAQYVMSLTYVTDVLESIRVGYVSATLQRNTQLLRYIDVTTKDGAAIRNYTLSYQASATTHRSQLHEVTECADAARTADCLAPTTINYQQGSAGVSYAGEIPSLYGIIPGFDFNGDGYDDVVHQSQVAPYNWIVKFGSAAGYNSDFDSGITNFAGAPVYITQLTSDGRGGFLDLTPGAQKYYTWNGSSFAPQSISIPIGTYETAASFIDVNGDGRRDIVTYCYSEATPLNNAICTYLNSSSAGSISFSSPTFTSLPTAGGHPWSVGGDSGRFGDRFDFNGDGRADLLMTIVPCESGGGVCDNETYHGEFILLSNGDTFTPNQFPGGVSEYFWLDFKQFLDWNNDNCTDLVLNNAVFISDCIDNGALRPFPSGYYFSTVIDWDGDGRKDILSGPGAGALSVFLSNGDSYSVAIPTSISADDCSLLVFDADHDGLDDLACVRSNGASFYKHNDSGTKPDLLSSIVDGFGVTFTPTYVAATRGSYTKDANAIYPIQDFFDPLYVVNQFTASDGIGGTYSRSFQYYGGKSNLQRSGFQGFRKTRMVDSRNGLIKYNHYETNFPYTGMLSRYELVQANDTTVLHQMVNVPNSRPLPSIANQQRYIAFVESSTEEQRESPPTLVNGSPIGGSKNGQLILTAFTSFTYDDYGNATTVVRTVTDNDTTAPASPYAGRTWTSTTVTNITPYESTWCLTLPTSVTVTNSYSPAITPSIPRTTTFPSPVNQTKCRTEHVIVQPSTAYQVAEDYEFDEFGNIRKVTRTGVGMLQRITEIDWGPRGQFPMTVTNPLGERTTLDYDFSAGQRSSYKDANNVETKWEYDGFGRKTLELRAGGTYTDMIYQDCANIGGCPVGSHGIRVLTSDHNTDGSVFRDGFRYLDIFDRPVVTGSRNFSGGFDRIDTRYDSFGRVAHRSMPCTWVSVGSPCPQETTTYYDWLSRPIVISRPIKDGDLNPQTTTYNYQGRTTVSTDALGKQTTKVATVTGALGRSQDHNGYYQDFTYDVFGSLVEVKDGPTSTLFSASYQYGLGAYKTSSFDVDLGTWGFTPNALGEIVAHTDANLTAFTTEYDKLSRPTLRTAVGEPNIEIKWGDDPSKFNIGKIEFVRKVGGPAEYYTYDAWDRLLKKQIFADSAVSYDFDYSYSPLTGLLKTLTYPESTPGYRLKLDYQYQFGYLQRVKDYNASTVFWRADSINNRGQVTQETLGNGSVTRRTYDSITGWLSSIQCGNATVGVACSQNQSYQWDKVGNMTQRQNNNLGLTEDFWYDDVHRLDYSKLNGSINLDMTYDAMGNITRRTDVANNALWTYHPTHKHQVIQAGSPALTYGYDANGNVTSRNGQTIVWDKYNYPTLINGVGESSALFYDGNMKRWKQVYTRGSQTETTIYVDKMLEKVSANGVDEYRHYVSAGGSAVAIVSRTSTGGIATRYLLQDALGSVSKIANDSGGSIVSESFTAYGARRNPMTWSGSPTNGDTVASNGITREGYAGHDGLGAMGLNHMDGRVQDAITGRFLSADSTVPHPGNTQSFNRYSYVRNNPLSLVDPSGFEDCPAGYYSDGGNCMKLCVAGLVYYAGSCIPDLPPVWGDRDEESEPMCTGMSCKQPDPYYQDPDKETKEGSGGTSTTTPADPKKTLPRICRERFAEIIHKAGISFPEHGANALSKAGLPELAGPGAMLGAADTLFDALELNRAAQRGDMIGATSSATDLVVDVVSLRAPAVGLACDVGGCGNPVGKYLGTIVQLFYDAVHPGSFLDYNHRGNGYNPHERREASDEQVSKLCAEMVNAPLE